MSEHESERQPAGTELCIDYLTSADAVAPEQIRGFFVDWRRPLDPESHLRLLRCSAHVVLARARSGQIVGFISAISDGCYAAYIPLLEVLPQFQGRGIGTQLVRRMLALLEPYQMVDLVCDEPLADFYRQFDFRPGQAMILRR